MYFFFYSSVTKKGNSSSNLYSGLNESKKRSKSNITYWDTDQMYSGKFGVQKTVVEDFTSDGVESGPTEKTVLTVISNFSYCDQANGIEKNERLTLNRIGLKHYKVPRS